MLSPRPKMLSRRTGTTRTSKERWAGSLSASLQLSQLSYSLPQLSLQPLSSITLAQNSALDCNLASFELAIHYLRKNQEDGEIVLTASLAQRVPSPSQFIKRSPSASPPTSTKHESATATDQERPPTTKHERPPTPTGILYDPTPTSEHRMMDNNSTPAQVLGTDMADAPTASMLRESIPTRDHHTANVEETSHHVPSSSEHEKHPSTRALAVPTQTSEQGMLDNSVEPTQVLDRVMVGSSSSNALHCSSSPIEDKTVDLETVSSRAIRPITQDRDFNGLSKQEIIVILAGYRSGEEGLASLSKNELLSLLKFYKVSDMLS